MAQTRVNCPPLACDPSTKRARRVAAIGNVTRSDASGERPPIGLLTGAGRSLELKFPPGVGKTLWFDIVRQPHGCIRLGWSRSMGKRQIQVLAGQELTTCPRT